MEIIMKQKSIIKIPTSYLSTTKYLKEDTIIQENQQSYSSGTLAISLYKTLTVKGVLTCL